MARQDPYIVARELQTLMDPEGPYASINTAAFAESERRAREEEAFAAQFEEFKAEEAKTQAEVETFDKALAQEDIANVAKAVGVGSLTEEGFQSRTPGESDAGVNQRVIPARRGAEAPTGQATQKAGPPTGQETSTIAGPTAEDVNARKDQAEKEQWENNPAYRALRQKGYTEEGAKTRLDPSRDALIETTSPLELLVPGAAIAAKLGGKLAVQGFLLSMPPDMLGTIYADEIAEDNMFIGLTVGLLFGGTAGIAGDAVATSRQTKAIFKRAMEAATDERVAKIATRYTAGTADSPRNKFSDLSHTSRTNFEATTYGKAQPKDFGKAYSTPLSTKGFAATPNLRARVAEVELRKLVEKVTIGDTRDPEVRKIISTIIEESKARQLSQEESSLIKGMEAKLAAAPEQTRTLDAVPESPLNESSNPGVSARVSAAVRNSVEAEWYGELPSKIKTNVLPDDRKFLGAAFQEDLRAEVKVVMDAAKARGEILNRKEVRAQVRAKLVREYEAGVTEDILQRTKNVDPTSLDETPRFTVRGGIEEPDAKFMTPAGTIEQRTIGGKVSYKFKDWDVTDHLVPTDDGRNLRYKGDLDIGPLPEGPELLPNTNTSKLFDYNIMETKAQAEWHLKNMQAQAENPSNRVWIERTVDGKTRKYKVNPEAEKLKVPTQVFSNTAGGKFIEIQALPDEEVEAVAQLLGWNESKIRINNSVTKDGKVYNMLEEDIVEGRRLKQEWDVTNPTWMKNQERLETDERHPRYWLMTFGDQAYTRQRDAYMRKVLGFEPYKANSPDYSFFNKLDSIAVNRNKLMQEVVSLEGGPQGPQAKRMYMLYGDTLAGTNRFDTLNRMTRAQARETAYVELMDMQSGSRSAADVDADIVALANREGLTVEDAAVVYADDAMDAAARQEATQEAMENWARQAGDDGVYDPTAAGRASDNAGTAMSIIEPVEPPGQKFTRLSRPERLAISEQVATIEDHFGVRVVDDLYTPGIGNSAGRVNIFKINNIKDLDALVKTFDQPVEGIPGASTLGEAVLDDVNPLDVIGIPANRVHDQNTVNRLTYILNDMQAQMGAMADRIIAHPDDILSAVAFEKLRAIDGILATQLADGAPSGQSLKALDNLNFLAFDDLSMADKIAKAVDSNYAIYKLSKADTSRTTMVAQMLADMPTPPTRGQLLHQLAKTDDYTKATDNLIEMVNGRKKLNSYLTKACT